MSGVAILYWEAGKRKTCELYILTAVAGELDVSARFLRADRALECGEDGSVRGVGRSDYIPFELKFPGRPAPLRLRVNVVRGDIGEPEPGGVTGALVGQRPAAVAELAGIWLSLHWWRKLFFPRYARGFDPEEDESGVQLLFMDHMAKALEILLAPRAKGVRLRKLGYLELLSTQSPEIREALPRFYQDWEPNGKYAPGPAPGRSA